MSTPSPTDLGAFLRGRRERLTPAEAGISPTHTSRRVNGLRREELAALAGVSVGYYTRLEQGVSRSASPAVIDALAVALHLDPVEHDHLRLLAAPARPTRPRTRRSTLRPSVGALLTSLAGIPAVVIDHRADVLAWNRLGHRLLASHLDVDAPDARIRAMLNFPSLSASSPSTAPSSRACGRSGPSKPVRTTCANCNIP